MSMRLTETLNKIAQGRKLSEAQLKKFKAGEATENPAVMPNTYDLMEKMVLNINGNYDKGRVSVQESLMSTDVVQLIPKVIEGQLREAAEPEYLATKFMNVVHVEGGSSVTYVIPVVGELRASEVAEGGRYNEDSVDFNTVENSQLEIRVKKIGLKVTITEEAVQDSSWDIYGINIRKMGQAMAR